MHYSTLKKSELKMRIKILDSELNIKQTLENISKFKIKCNELMIFTRNRELISSIKLDDYYNIQLENDIDDFRKINLVVYNLFDKIRLRAYAFTNIISQDYDCYAYERY